MTSSPYDIDPTNPLARAKRAIEMLDYIFPGYTIQEAASEALQDLMHLEDSLPDGLHLIGALEDARNQHEAIAETEPVAAAPGETAQVFTGHTHHAGANVVDLEEKRFERGHADEPKPA